MDPYNSADALGVPAGVPSVTPPAAPAANPYAAPTARLAEVRDSDELVKSSRMSRLGAAIIDSLIFVVPAMIIAVMVPGVGMSETGEITGVSTALIGLFAIAAIAFMIYQLVLLHRHGQTVGKKLVGIRIVRQDGERASLGRIVGLRYLVPGLIGSIPLLGPLFSLVNVLFIFGEERRCIHDMFADTIVVDA